LEQATDANGSRRGEDCAQTLTRARDLATEDEARQRFKTFVGTGSAYTASR